MLIKCLGANSFEKSALHYLKTVTQTHFKSLLIDVHIVLELKETNGCLGVKKKSETRQHGLKNAVM